MLSAPPPAEVTGYLRRALPAAGFTILSADASGSAVTFAGHGWRGSFTSDARASAVLLRPGSACILRATPCEAQGVVPLL